MAVQGLGWGPGDAVGAGWGSQSRERPLLQSIRPQVPSPFLEQNSWTERWLGVLASLPASIPPATEHGAVHPSVSIRLTQRKAHQGHQEQGEQGCHGWR